MNSKSSIVKGLVVAAALAVGASGMARADETPSASGQSYPLSVREMQKLSSPSPAYRVNPPVDTAPSAWRQSRPNGLSVREFETMSSSSPAYKLPPRVDNAPSTWRQSHPNGLSNREMEAMSSDAPAWHQPDQSATSALASTNDAAVMTSASREPLGARIARFFHVTPANQATPAN